jgi:hypothetical protein
MRFPVQFYGPFPKVHNGNLSDADLPLLFTPFFRSRRDGYPCKTGSPECECESFHPRIQELDLELPISNRAWLSDQQIQPLFSDRAVPLTVNIDPVSRAPRLAVDQNAKSHGSPRHGRSHDEMKIASIETMSRSGRWPGAARILGASPESAQ